MQVIYVPVKMAVAYRDPVEVLCVRLRMGSQKSRRKGCHVQGMVQGMQQ